MSKNQENWWAFFITSKRLEEFQWNLLGRCDMNRNNIMNNKNMIILKDKFFEKPQGEGRAGRNWPSAVLELKCKIYGLLYMRWPHAEIENDAKEFVFSWDSK